MDASEILTEERALQGATTSHIDAQKFRDFLERQGLDVDEAPQPPGASDLRNRGVLVETGGALLATLYGVLAFGKEPQRYPQTRNFRIECVAYAGKERASDVLQVADATGCVDDQVQRALGWFASLGHTETYHDVIREDRPLLPRRAIREALVNAVAHRDYAVTGSKVLLESFSNRIVVTSPGPLPNHMRVESARAGANPRSRNELLANFMLVSGFMDNRGRGWPLMRAEMRRFNGTEPLLEQDPHWVRVTFAVNGHSR